MKQLHIAYFLMLMSIMSAVQMNTGMESVSAKATSDKSVYVGSSSDTSDKNHEIAIDVDEDECSICFKPLQNIGHDIVTLGCGTNTGKHTFHFKCLLKHQQKRVNDQLPALCPLCRHDMTTANNHKHRVFSTLELLTKERDMIREANCLTLPCFKAFKLIDTIMTICIGSRSGQ